MTEQCDNEEEFSYVYYGHMAEPEEVKKNFWNNILLRDTGK